MRILSWNVAHNRAMWDNLEALRAQHPFDVALLQEAVVPGGSAAGRSIEPSSANPDSWRTEVWASARPWRTAIAWWQPLQAEAIQTAPLAEVREDTPSPLPISYPGSFTAVRVGETTLVSLYGVWEHLPGGRESYSVAAMHRAISDLTRLWFGRWSAARVVIAGDWNLYRDYGDWASLYGTVFSRLEAEQLRLVGPFGPGVPGCPCGDSKCRHVQTYWHGHKAESRPYQTDFVAASKAVVVNTPVVVNELNGEPVWREMSDHAPVLFEVTD
jgi:exonuclease III